VSAVGSLAAAEMTQMRRITRLMPPLCNMGLPLVWLPHISYKWQAQYGDDGIEKMAAMAVENHFKQIPIQLNHEVTRK
jgi:hypothetical protein